MKVCGWKGSQSTAPLKCVSFRWKRPGEPLWPRCRTWRCWTTATCRRASPTARPPSRSSPACRTATWTNPVWPRDEPTSRRRSFSTSMWGNGSEAKRRLCVSFPFTGETQQTKNIVHQIINQTCFLFYVSQDYQGFLRFWKKMYILICCDDKDESRVAGELTGGTCWILEIILDGQLKSQFWDWEKKVKIQKLKSELGNESKIRFI